MRWQGQISRLMVFPIIVVDIDHSPSMMLFRQGTLRCDVYMPNYWGGL